MHNQLQSVDTIGIDVAIEKCRNCDETMAGNYCVSCGEKRFDHHELSLKHFIEHSVHEFIHLDSKVFKTFRLLLFKPGHLTKEYLDGRKSRYISPLRLFITIAALTLVLVAIYHPDNALDLKSVMKLDQTGGVSAEVKLMAAKLKMDEQLFVEQFTAKLQKLNSILTYCSILLFAVFLKAFYWRANRYYVEHLIFSLHFYSFTYLIGVITLVVFQAKIGIASILAIIIYSTYLFLAMRTNYSQSIIKTLVKTLFGLILFFTVENVFLVLSFFIVTVHFFVIAH